MKPLKKAVAFVIYHEDGHRILAVLRPEDDRHLPNLRGLPAGTLKEGESFEDCVLRSGQEKLGVTLQIVGLVGEGQLERENYVLLMKEFEVEIIKGEPVAPQDALGVTQYQEWKWAEPQELVEAAGMGSLCSQLFLKSKGLEW